MTDPSALLTDGKDRPELVSIGILACNEEDNIGRTLVSLLKQTALNTATSDLSRFDWEIIVVANGCSDDTAGVARHTLGDLVPKAGGRINFAVRELTEPGKSNAWNHYVHNFSSNRSTFIVMLDADIEFGEPETIANTIVALLQDSNADVAVDLPLKDVVRKSNKTLLEWLTATASRVSTIGPPGIAGSFYCGRAKKLRNIWMPKGLPVEDGFLRAMIVTDCFRSQIDERKVIRARNASHYYETLIGIRSIFRHELRLVIGTAVNCYLTWDFLLFATDPAGPGAGALIKNRTAADPLWYSKLIANAIMNRGFWVLPRGMLLRRFRELVPNTSPTLAKQFIIAVVGFLLDLPIFLAANRRLKRGGAISYW